MLRNRTGLCGFMVESTPIRDFMHANSFLLVKNPLFRHLTRALVFLVAALSLIAQVKPTQIEARAKDAMVQIRVFDSCSQIVGAGNGFVVSTTGVVVTNFHLVDGAFALQIELPDGEIYDDVSYLTADPRRD